MKVQIQAVNFKADKDLVVRVEERISSLDKYYEHIVEASVLMDVQKTSDKDNKNIEIILGISGDDIVVKKTAATFEDALNQAITAAKKILIKHKEKQRKK